MKAAPQWTELTAQQLVRYDALFKLLDAIQVTEEVAQIARLVATQWKYFANVSSYRLVVARHEGFLVIDGSRGDGIVAEVAALSPWDAFHWARNRPRRIRLADRLDGPAPPEHLARAPITEVEVLPFLRMGRCIGLLSAAARHQPFTELDDKFIRLFGGHFAERVFGILLQRHAIDVLTRLATHDPLTGLLNRGAVIDGLERLLAQRRRAGRPLGVILIDIDLFKAINDSHGHQAGDEVLREVAARLQAQTRDADLLGRYGGEEFLVVLFDCSVDSLSASAERLRCAIADTPFAVGGDMACLRHVTISLGTAGLLSDGAQAPAGAQALLKRADEALYRAKADGRNCIRSAPV